MAGWNGSGTFVRLHNWVADKLASIKIIASRMDGEFDNYKTGLENCLTRDGQTPPTANVPMGGFQITGLAAGSAATDGVNYGQISGIGRRNFLLNGGFDVWQSGTPITGTAARVRTADCWWAIRQGTTGYTVSRQTGAVNNFALNWQRNNANASTENMILAQSLESVNVRWMRLGTPPTLTFSFYAKSGANYSGGNLTVDVVRGTGTDQNVIDTYTGATVIGTLAQALTGTLTRYSVTATVDASTTELGVRFTWTPTGVAGADDSVTLENCQLEVGTSAGTFEYLPFSGTLALCQRYYEKSFQYAVTPAQNNGVGTSEFLRYALRAGATTQGEIFVPYQVYKRALATPVTYNPGAANANPRDETAGADCTIGGTSNGFNGFHLSITGNASTAIANTIGFHWTVADANF
jgi:hypothetical protein